PIQALPRSSRSSSHPSFPYVFLRYTPALPRVLHSFPTRRSSDLQVCPPAFHIVEKRFKRHVFMRTCQSDYALVALLRQTVNLILDRKSTRLNSSHVSISYAVFCLKKKNKRSPLKRYGKCHTACIT